jgi:hypothetical protein
MIRRIIPWDLRITIRLFVELWDELVLEVMPDTSRCRHFVSSGPDGTADEQSLA